MKKILAGSAVFVTIIFLITGAYLRFSALESKNPSKTQKSASISDSASVSASGIFIIPPGGKEVNRDTTGRRVAYYSVDDKITILADNPKALFLINETISPDRIRKKGLSGRVLKLGTKNYLRFENYGDKEEKIKARVTPRY